MADDEGDEFEDETTVVVDEPDDIDEELAGDELDEDLVGEDGIAEGTAVVAEDEDEDDDDDDSSGPERPARPATAGDDDEEEPDPDDVEADLDTILKDRIAAGDDDEDEEEEEQPGRTAADTEEGGGRVAPRKAGEFVCTSCFLVKPNSQLADTKRKLCLDCV